MGNITGKEESLIDGGYPLPISKLYNKTDCDLRIVRKFIVDKKLSPFYKGLPDSTDLYDTECPICFLYYPSNLNLSRCCKQPICTECFLQIKHPASGGPASCPFCVEPEYGIIYKDPSLKSPKQNEKEKEKEEKIVSVPHTSPSVVQIDSIRPNGRKPIPVLEPVQTSTRRMTISGRPTNRHRRSQHGPSSFTQESTISNSQFPTASRRATSDTLFAVQDVESEMERIMIMEAIRLSLISQRERERERENEIDSLDESIENETEQRSEAKDEPNPPRTTIDMGTSV